MILMVLEGLQALQSWMAIASFKTKVGINFVLWLTHQSKELPLSRQET